ncbi:protein arginine N-methyltransferase HSL7 [Blumeria hordei DH14]|uniref:Protein arginine N-methyltransferase n=1 Tax=Blumeria graminis f. sp. hordei (strain DH14) TaxID=546991 RepID=N1JIC1_BLUG1|nr:protein arginine N-methyltransferase HSL7 [Blumeria hordei DH14]
MESPEQEVEPSLPLNDYTPTFYIGHHESRRTLPVVDLALREAQDVGYDMVTCPITTEHFQSRVLALISNYLGENTEAKSRLSSAASAPIIPPLTPADSSLVPGTAASQLIAYSSPWIDLASSDPLLANISRQVLNIEVAYASFCGIGNVIVSGPRTYSNVSTSENKLVTYARAIQEALVIGNFTQIAIHIPMYECEFRTKIKGDISLLSTQQNPSRKTQTGQYVDLYETWDAWNVIRSVCKYNPRLAVALEIPRKLPIESLQSRWFAEPLRLLLFNASTFLMNKDNYPVLSKSHQTLLSRYMRLKQPPWLMLCDFETFSILEKPENVSSSVDNNETEALPENATPENSTSENAPQSILPGSSGDSVGKETFLKNSGPNDSAVARLKYLRYLQRNQPAQTTIEKFGSGYQDYLQAPLQPLTDNLESVTYEVFEKDPVKYDSYEKAIALALSDWSKHDKPTSGPNKTIVVAVVGAGRGPLVSRALAASRATGTPIELWAIEKNPNAFVLLQRHNMEDWGGVVNIVKSDMRAWKGPHRFLNIPDEINNTSIEPSISFSYGKVDILVSELLGSFADNELSPECLDGVQHVLAPGYGISIPSSYTAHLTPISAPRLFTDISHRITTDDTANDTPYVVMLHAFDFLATSVPDHPRIQEAWEFVHPLPCSTLAISEARRSGGVSGGGGGSMSGSDGANEHNVRSTKCKFICRDRGAVHGIAGYFEAVLYDGGLSGKVELSTRPDTIEAKSPDTISWFPIYFPLKTPVYFPDDSEVEISMWRQTDDRKVWYEWIVEAFVMMGPDKRLRLGISEMGSSNKVGCLM